MANDTNVYDWLIVTRSEARAAGLKRYLGKPCVRGHGGERYVSRNDCVVCGRIKSAARYAADPEGARLSFAAYRATHLREERMRNNAWRAANPERARANGAAWWAANPQKKRGYELARPPRTAEFAAYQIKNRKQLREYRHKNRYTRKATADVWRKANPERMRARAHRRRALVLQASGAHTGTDIKALFKMQRGKCAHPWCATSLEAGWEVDHVIPLAKSGSNDKRNLALLCTPCNRKKNAKHPIDHAQENGFLL